MGLEYMPQINFGLDSGKETKFVIDRGQHMVRRKLRLYTYNSHNHVRVLIDPTAKQLERLVRVLQIPRENIVSIVNLPDVRVARAAGEPGERTVNTGVYDHHRNKVEEVDLPEAFDLWLPIERGNSKSIEVPGFGTFDPRHGLSWIYSFGAMCGLPEKPYMLTPKAQKQYEINDFSRYDLVLRDAIEEMLPLFLRIHHDYTLKNNIQKRAVECGIFEFAPGMLETDAPEGFPLDQFIKAVYGQWRSPYLLWLKSEYDVGYAEAESRAQDKVAELKAMYPLVFDNYDKLAIRTYMEVMTERLK